MTTIPARLRKWAAQVEEAHLVSKLWRSESWQDEGMYDGEQATPAEIEAYKKKGIELITINRTFPAVNLILGNQAINRTEITAKARTSKDSEISQTMTESVKYVMDQNSGYYAIAEAFKNQIIPGVGNLFVGKNRDPRKEKVTVLYRDWKECFSDPFAPLWAGADVCRYKFWQKWVDLDTLQAAFPEKKKELDGLWSTLTEKTSEDYSLSFDEAEEVEELRQIAAGTPWIDAKRRRVRPVEIWYPKPTNVLFAVFEDSSVKEIDEKLPPQEQMEMANQAVELINATVPKMFNAVFCSTVILKDETPSDLGHDEYPFIPFVGYVDRNGFPYGVPRQIRGQDKEVNKRRSMALALMNTRRITAEVGVADTPKQLDDIHKEANALDGMVIVKNGAIGKIKIEENTELAVSQIGILGQSEKEIQEISGANGEATGYQTNVTSRVGLDKKEQQSGKMTAPLFDNLRRSIKMVGERITAGIQKEWTHPKVLRVTDRLTGADKWLEVNKRLEDGGIKNNLTMGRFDMIVTDSPKSDTIREKNMNLILEWVKKSPPEVIPHLMNIAFEMADLPNKEQFLEKIKPLLGYDPLEEEMDAETRKQKLIEQLEAEKEAQAQQVAIQEEDITLELNQKRLKNAEFEAKIKEVMAKTAKTEVDTRVTAAEAEIEQDNHEMDKASWMLESTEKGLDIGGKMAGTTEQME